MIGRLLGLLSLAGTFLVALSIGTLIAAALMLAVVWSKWDMNVQKVEQMLAIAQGYDLAAMREEADRLRQAVPPEQPSFDQVIEARAMKDRNIELREQALAQAVEDLRFQQRKQAEDLRRFDQARQAFEAKLIKINEAGTSTGMQENIVIFQNMKPSQAKELLVQMYDEGQIDPVVRLVAGMNPSKRKRITGEFKTPDEQKKLGDILQRIREGFPLAALTEETEKQLQPATPAQP